MAEDRTGVVARLDALEAAHKAATQGPWALEGFEILAPRHRLVAETGWRPDAAAIVAEHNSYGHLLAAVRGVLALADELESFTVNRNPAPGSYDAGVVAAFVNVAARLRSTVALGTGGRCGNTGCTSPTP